ncbi:hypothetical protein AVEN_109582-1 [Araneus ventricosus]|uniref:Uncharacterized protein n=1 Tax=Araneus ventricosus TaxID=182803 RepID=A0A4Y2VL98_ARAVE|nr:hypothetical protein AVEN_109582-1 [Araneus ventricosus]
MFGYRWRWLIGRLAQLLEGVGLLFVDESVWVATSRREARCLGLVVVVIFGIALAFKCNVPHPIFYVYCLSYMCPRPNRIIFLNLVSSFHVAEGETKQSQFPSRPMHHVAVCEDRYYLKEDAGASNVTTNTPFIYNRLKPTFTCSLHTC